jgi:GNAT superfamily N-acetyltransferase
MARAQQIRERWHLALSILRYGGVGRFMGIVVRGIVKPLVSWRTFCFFERTLTGPVTPFKPSIPLDIRIATDADFDRFRDALLRERVDASEIERRRANGDLCFMGLAQDRLVHFTWLLRGLVWLPALGATLELGGNEAYVHFSYTDPAMRGRGVQPAVTNFMVRWELEAGIERHFYFVMGHNTSAMRITSGRHVGTAARPSRTVRTVHLLGTRGFLVVGLLGEQRPLLKPATNVDWGRFGLWVKP